MVESSYSLSFVFRERFILQLIYSLLHHPNVFDIFQTMEGSRYILHTSGKYRLYRGKVH